MELQEFLEKHNNINISTLVDVLELANYKFQIVSNFQEDISIIEIYNCYLVVFVNEKFEKLILL